MIGIKGVKVFDGLSIRRLDIRSGSSSIILTDGPQTRFLKAFPHPCSPCPGLDHPSLCALSGADEDWRRRKTGVRILKPYMRMLMRHGRQYYVRSYSRHARGFRPNSRFSPVWLYIWVCSELGRVNRLSHTLHLCFFCALDDTLELNELIIDCGAGGW